MRYSKIFFIFLLAEAILFSCSKKVLDLRPLGQLDPTAVTNKQGVTALLIGAYSLLDGVGSPNSNPVNPGNLPVRIGYSALLQVVKHTKVRTD